VLNKAELTDLSKRLRDMRNEIIDTLQSISDAAQPVELDQNKVGRLSRMDAMQSQKMAQASEHRQRENLRLIEYALKRIEQYDVAEAVTDSGLSEYGRCLECDEWIAIERLQADPMTQFCITCAADLERS